MSTSVLDGASARTATYPCRMVPAEEIAHYHEYGWVHAGLTWCSRSPPTRCGMGRRPRPSARLA